LVQSAAVVAHHVQHERRLLTILVASVELRLAFVDQNGLRLALPRRDENYSPIRQVVRRDIVTCFGRRRVFR